MVYTATNFDFGLETRVEVDLNQTEPDPQDYIAYTAYHVASALEYHAFKSNKIVEPVIQHFKPVSCRT